MVDIRIENIRGYKEAEETLRRLKRLNLLAIQEMVRTTRRVASRVGKDNIQYETPIVGNHARVGFLLTPNGVERAKKIIRNEIAAAEKKIQEGLSKVK